VAWLVGTSGAMISGLLPPWAWAWDARAALWDAGLAALVKFTVREGDNLVIGCSWTTREVRRRAPHGTTLDTSRPEERSRHVIHAHR
jgi:hypothetical protein